MTQLDRRLGRSVFGGDPAGYHAARPGYPEFVYDILRERCGLRPGTPTFEVGAGTGIATGRLLHIGAAPLAAIEPDPRLAAFLRASLPTEDLQVLAEPFEETPLPSARFDLGLAATSFHWVEAEAGLAQVARLLRPGGWWAMVWNVFGDERRHDAFHEATVGLLGESRSPAAGAVRELSFGEDHVRRAAELEAAGVFEDIAYQSLSWTLTLGPPGVRALYATYSEINARPPEARERLLDALMEIAEREFAGKVERNMVTAIHTARRR
ncbi:methyltransferase domain-containing protein [Phenylobacterium sp.]|uniref:methyltransferase domain-containing protein n=1 Tax=Phenylobacterium sp. TaxID=1871053 RepID=UPI002733F9B0|nr:methyltransferase domain-containing protein [Phenylobacterium sp.]MDP3852277.1 methyltransferase domain-containing protein [Phenylobacterium sp.]